MRIYLKNNRAKFHPDSIWNDRALGFLKKASPNKNNNNKKKKNNNNNQLSRDDPKMN